jgi:catechol 2,3-dioxygenase-like lactoylglutathione lyase family enzyme
MTIRIAGLDHIVLCVADVQRTLEFYQRVLGLDAREERPGKWSLHFGAQKISLQEAASAPDIARATVPGSGNFCLLTSTPLAEVIAVLARQHIPILAGPAQRAGATGPLQSIYFHDPDHNLIEVSTPL